MTGHAEEHSPGHEEQGKRVYQEYMSAGKDVAFALLSEKVNTLQKDVDAIKSTLPSLLSSMQAIVIRFDNMTSQNNQSKHFWLGIFMVILVQCVATAFAVMRGK